jgi:hypothetical protein
MEVRKQEGNLRRPPPAASRAETDLTIHNFYVLEEEKP